MASTTRWRAVCAVIVIAAILVTLLSGMSGAGRAQEIAPAQATGVPLRLAYQAAAELSTGTRDGLIRAVLLATESLRLGETPEAVGVLDAGMALLPHYVYKWETPFSSPQLSPDEQRIALRNGDVHVLWRLPDGTDGAPAEIAVLDHPCPADRLFCDVRLLFWPDSSRVLTWSQERARIWSAAGGTLLADLEAPEPTVYAMRVSPDGQRLIMASPTSVHIWDTGPETPPGLLSSFSLSEDEQAALSQSGRFLAIVQRSGRTVRLFATDDAALLRSEETSEVWPAVHFSPDDNYFLVADRGLITAREMGTGAALGTYRVDVPEGYLGSLQVLFNAGGDRILVSHSSYYGAYLFPFPPPAGKPDLTVADSLLFVPGADAPGGSNALFSPDGRRIMRYDSCAQKVCPSLRNVDVFNAQWYAAHLEFTHRFRGYLLAPILTGNGLLLTSSFENNFTTRIWNVAHGDELARLPGANPILGASGRWLVVTETEGDRSLYRLLRADPGAQWRSWRHDDAITVMAYSPDRRLLATGGDDQLIRLWDTTDGRLLRAVRAPVYYLSLVYGSINQLVFSPDGRWLASLNGEGHLQVWNVATLLDAPADTDLEATYRFTSRPWRAVHFSADSRLLYAESIWDLATGALIEDVPGGYVVSEDGQYAVAVNGRQLEISAIASGELQGEIDLPVEPRTVHFAPDGSTLLVADETGTRLWAWREGRVLFELPAGLGEATPVFSRDAARLAYVDGDGIVHVWDLVDSRELSTLPYVADKTRVQFTPDGDSLAIYDRDGYGRIFAVADGQLLAERLFPAGLTALLFTGEGDALAGDAEGRIHRWQWRAADLLATACDHLPRNLTTGEWRRYFGTTTYRTTCGELPDLSIPTPTSTPWTPRPTPTATQQAADRTLALPTPTPAPAHAPAPPPAPPLPLKEPPTDRYRPAGDFEEIWASSSAVYGALGWAVDASPFVSAAALQPFEGGFMVWVAADSSIYVIDDRGTWQRFADRWQEGEPESDPALSPPAERLQPVRGFGKVWREQEAVQATLGWALAPERAVELVGQRFEEGGVILRVDDQIFVLAPSGADQGYIVPPASP